ncbi:MAG: type II secretion system protein, partial [Myxococcales bacterium]|nr:type II secretion system protein [Myxococcales bacterium]
MRPQLRKRSSQAGFTLIEVIVSLAILAFSLSTLMGLQALTTQQLRMAEQLNTGSMLVRLKMMAVE